MQTDLSLLISALLAIIPVSVGIRVIVCLIKMNTDPDQAQLYKTRANNALLFVVVAECAMSLLLLIRLYLSGG